MNAREVIDFLRLEWTEWDWVNGGDVVTGLDDEWWLFKKGSSIQIGNMIDWVGTQTQIVILYPLDGNKIQAIANHSGEIPDNYKFDLHDPNSLISLKKAISSWLD